MARHVIIDGYNVIKQVAEFADLAIDAGRERLIRAIETRQPHGSSRNAVTVVFDGKPGKVSAPLSATVRVLFSYEQSADDQIKALAADALHPREVVVVTNDREIQRHVRASGAAVWSVSEFMSKMKTVAAGGPAALTPSGETAGRKGLSKVLEHKINSELNRLWLSKPKTQ